MKFRFQSFFDVSTSASSMQVLQFSVGGNEVLSRCRHLFGAYKYFKLGKISIKMVPASTLPVDPLGLSYSDSDPQTVDPRDQMNPGLVRITNGEDIRTDISALTDGQQRAVYQAMMLDPRWSKFMLQSGFRRSAYPLYWQVGQLSQDKYPGATINQPYNQNNTKVARLTGATTQADLSSPLAVFETGLSSARGLFQVGHRGRLGFLPTDYYQQVPDPNTTASTPDLRVEWGINNIPEVSVITCILPKAYKTLYYYRIFVTEEVIFTGLKSAPWDISSGTAMPGAGYLGLDSFALGAPIVPDASNNHTLVQWPSGTVAPNNNGEDMP